MKEAPPAYSKGMQIVHWLSVLLILTMIPIGLIMIRMDMNATKTTLFQVHVALGLLVLLLTAIRLILRFIRPVPPTPTDITGVRKLLFQGIHLFQYLTLIALVISGVSILLNSGVGLLPTNVTPPGHQYRPVSGQLSQSARQILYFAHRFARRGRSGISVPAS